MIHFSSIEELQEAMARRAAEWPEGVQGWSSDGSAEEPFDFRTPEHALEKG